MQTKRNRSGSDGVETTLEDWSNTAPFKYRTHLKGHAWGRIRTCVERILYFREAVLSGGKYFDCS
jgi:hypothetical protein